MCGICGFVGISEPGLLGRMTASISHRGPDDDGFYEAEGVGLGMRRLVAQTAEDNVASNTVLDRLGFTIWGRETAADVLPDGRAVEPTSVVSLDAACLRGKCEADPRLGYELAMRAAQTMSQRLQATRARLLDMYAAP